MSEISHKKGFERMTSRHFPALILFTALFCGLLFFVGSKASGRGQYPAADYHRTEHYAGHDVAAGRVIVKFRDQKSSIEMAHVEASLDAETNERLGGTGARLIRSRSRNTQALIEELKSRSDVLYVEPDYLAIGGAAPNDSQYGFLWGLNNTGQSIQGTPGTPGAHIAAQAAWDRTTGTRNIVVAISDSGVDYNHPDLNDNLWSAPAAFTVNINGQSLTCGAGTRGYNAILNNCDPLDDHNHGTHVAGTIGAVGNNGTGVAGVNWQTSMMTVKWINSQNSGFISDAIKSLEFVIQARNAFAATGGADVRIINNSWYVGSSSNALLEQVRRVQANGMLFVAIAGNGISNNFIAKDNDVSPTYPGSYNEPNILTTAATTNQDGIASFSNFGKTSVHLGAPGANVFSTIRNGGYGYFNGTSMAAPHVAGAAALLLSRCDLTAAGLKGTLLAYTDAIPALADKTTSGGRLNVSRALEACTAYANIADDERFFVRQHYVDFLNREPDAAGLAFWLNEITSCGGDAQCREVKRINVSAAFFLSIEFQQTAYLVYRAYKAGFGNIQGKPVPIRREELLPEMQQIAQGVIVGQSGWEQKLEQNKQAFFDQLVTRQKFITLYPQAMSAGQFVDALNANAGGALSQAERNALVNELVSGARTRAQVLRAVAEDADLSQAEFNRAFVLMQYFGYMRRNPDDAPDGDFSGWQFWLSKLEQFNGNFIQAEMVKAFISSFEYRRRFGPV
jgi:subtilisin family serine protease